MFRRMESLERRKKERAERKAQKQPSELRRRMTAAFSKLGTGLLANLTKK